MDIQPAHIDQLRRARDGRMIPIDKDAGNVAADLQAIDPHLKVRFGENGQPPFWAVYWESDDRRSTYLVLTQEATRTRSGIWTGLDQRIVKRVMEISSDGYDYASELAKGADRVRQEKRDRFREQVAEKGEEAAHAIRKDLGHKGRAVVPRDV